MTTEEMQIPARVDMMANSEFELAANHQLCWYKITFDTQIMFACIVCNGRFKSLGTIFHGVEHRLMYTFQQFKGESNEIAIINALQLLRKSTIVPIPEFICTR